jgi:hypothetical protein
MLVEIKDNKNLIRDVNNRAILNTDIEGLKAYYAARNQALKEREEKQKLSEKVNNLEKDITEIKDLLKQVLEMRTINGN